MSQLKVVKDDDTGFELWIGSLEDCVERFTWLLHSGHFVRMPSTCVRYEIGALMLSWTALEMTAMCPSAGGKNDGPDHL